MYVVPAYFVRTFKRILDDSFTSTSFCLILHVLDKKCVMQLVVCLCFRHLITSFSIYSCFFLIFVPDQPIHSVDFCGFLCQILCYKNRSCNRELRGEIFKGFIYIFFRNLLCTARSNENPTFTNK